MWKVKPLLSLICMVEEVKMVSFSCALKSSVFFRAVVEEPPGRLSAFIQTPPTVSLCLAVSLIGFKVGDVCASKVSELWTENGLQSQRYTHRTVKQTWLANSALISRFVIVAGYPEAHRLTNTDRASWLSKKFFESEMNLLGVCRQQSSQENEQPQKCESVLWGVSDKPKIIWFKRTCLLL